MKNTINKIITALLKLTPKYTNLSTKLNEVILSEEEISTLNIKLDDILTLVNGNSSSDSGTDTISNLVSLGILPKQISEYTDTDIGSIISIPYNDESGNITGPIEFEVVGINHHKDINDESKPTITLMSKNILRYAAFDAKEPNNPTSNRANAGNNRWSVSNIRQWLNSSGAANEWFTAQHEYDTVPDTTNVDYNESGAYSDEAGFLAGFSDVIKQHFATVANITLLPSVDGSGTETTQDKVFLPSYTEMNFGNLDDNPEGTALSGKFTNSSSRGKTGAESYYLMRSPGWNSSGSVFIVIEQGSADQDSADSGYSGVAPLLVLC